MCTYARIHVCTYVHKYVCLTFNWRRYELLNVLLAAIVNEMVTDDTSIDARGGATMAQQEAATTCRDLKSAEQLQDTMSTQGH